MLLIRRVQAQLNKENERYNELKNEQGKQERDLKELQAELKRSKIKSMKEQEAYNNTLQVGVNFYTLNIFLYLMATSDSCRNSQYFISSSIFKTL